MNARQRRIDSKHKRKLFQEAVPGSLQYHQALNSLRISDFKKMYGNDWNIHMSKARKVSASK